MPEHHQSSKIFFFLLSGENPELALFEFESVVSTLNIPGQIESSPDNRIVEFNVGREFNEISVSNIVLSLVKRMTMVHFCCESLFKCEFDENMPLSFIELTSRFDVSLVQNLDPDLSFSVKSKRIGQPIGIFCQKKITQEVSAFVGAMIQKENPSKRVDLENPDEKFIVILSKFGFWLGKHFSSSLRNDVRKRTSHKRPFFHPSSMNPILQRTMINLSGIKPGEWLLDPFCGTGGGLLEAARLGINSVGVEIDRRMIWGSKKNLASDCETRDKTYLVFGDATKLPFKKRFFSAIVTDPPYGTAASTQGLDLSDLLLDFIKEVSLLVKSQSRVVFAIPAEINIEDKAKQILKANYRIFYQYVHRSLTRKIIVFQLK